MEAIFAESFVSSLQQRSVGNAIASQVSPAKFQTELFGSRVRDYLSCRGCVTPHGPQTLIALTISSSDFEDAPLH
jgi:hypothetical protein